MPIYAKSLQKKKCLDYPKRSLNVCSLKEGRVNSKLSNLIVEIKLN